MRGHLLRAGMLPSGGGGGLLLDDYPGAAAAYSLRQLRTGVTSVVRVRRSSDSAEADFTAAEISDGTLTAWVGAGDGFVRTWYDQSGNGRDAEQTVTNRQPIVSGTSVDFFTDPARVINLSLSLPATGASCEVFAVRSVRADPAVNNLSSGWWKLGVVGSSLANNHAPFSDGNIYDDFGSTVRKSCGNPVASLTAQHVYNVQSSAGSWDLWINNTLQFSTLANTVALPGIGFLGNQAIDTSNAPTYLAPMYLSEVALYPAAVPASRQSIRDNQMAHYGIP